MRTTVTIDDNLLEIVKDRARAEGVTLGEIVEASLQRYLALPEPPAGPELPVFRGGTGFVAGIDATSNISMLGAADEDGDAAVASSFG